MGVFAMEDEMMRRAVASENKRQLFSGALGFLILVLLLSPLGYGLAMMREMEGRERIIGAIVASIGMVVTGYAVIRIVQWLTGGTVNAIVHPGGATRAGKTYSQALSLAAAGRLDEAAAAFEALRAESGDDVITLRAEAEMHAGPGGDPRRASELFLRLRRVAVEGGKDELYASHRLIDLYHGALNDPGKVMVELRRMADRFPDTIDGQGARAELQRRRDEARRLDGESA
jgi:hypothetical protein